MRVSDLEHLTPVTDLRLALPAMAAWVSAAVALGVRGPVVPVAAGIATVGVLLLVTARSARVTTAAAMLCCAAAAAASAALHASAASPAVLTRAADAGLTGRVELVLSDDPMPVRAEPGPARGRPLVRFTARLNSLDVAGHRTRLRARVFVLAPAVGWSELLPGQRVTATARLAKPEPQELLGAVVLARAPPSSVEATGRLHQVAATIRAGLRHGVEPLPAGPEALLPGLVIGDTSRISNEVLEEFRATGLTHLVAVSGANLAIVVATVMVLARRLGAGRRLSGVLAGLAMLGFVIVARPSPSVLRAAVMGAVVLVGLQEGRRSAAVPALAAATFLLVLLDPSLARAPGFALSVLATAGIVLCAVPLRRRMPGWLPGWLAEAIAVPLAAQIACTPVLVALFGRLSLVAVPANLLAAPAVPLATVVGVLVGVLAPIALTVAQLVARLAQLPAAWLLFVASRGARVPGAQIGWPTGATGAALAILATVAFVLVLRRRLLRVLAVVVVLSALVTVVGLVRLAPAWPPDGWAMVACDVGQGDGLVLAAGAGAGVVIDVGPDPRAMNRCLAALGVRRVPLVILSHPHADHVEGLPGVLQNRSVGEILVGPLDEPPGESARVRRWATAAGVLVRRVVDGEVGTAGRVSWQVLAPSHPFSGSESDPNNSSIVLRVQLPGFVALLTGDIELEAQRELLRSGRDVSADVLKVPHHGSGRQLPELFRRVGARLAVASVGADNDYGHPAAITVQRLASVGAHTFRTDRDGAVAFLRRGPVVVGVGRRRSGSSAIGQQFARPPAGEVPPDGEPKPSGQAASDREPGLDVRDGVPGIAAPPAGAQLAFGIGPAWSRRQRVVRAGTARAAPCRYGESRARLAISASPGAAVKWHFPVPVQAGGAWVGVHLSSGSGAVGRELLRLAGPPRSFEAKYANLGCGGVDRDLLRIPRAPALVRANEGG